MLAVVLSLLTTIFILGLNILLVANCTRRQRPEVRQENCTSDRNSKSSLKSLKKSPNSSTVPETSRKRVLREAQKSHYSPKNDDRTKNKKLTGRNKSKQQDKTAQLLEKQDSTSKNNTKSDSFKKHSQKQNTSEERPWEITKTHHKTNPLHFMEDSPPRTKHDYEKVLIKRFDDLDSTLDSIHEFKYPAGSKSTTDSRSKQKIQVKTKHPWLRRNSL